MNRIAVTLLGLCVSLSPTGKVQGGQARAAATPPVAKAAAPIDLTGTWVSIVSEDWRWRMITPPKGDYASIPLNPAARKLADTWDPAKDEAAGEQCKAYGPPGVMRLPGRFRISWQDDNTLKVETDAGTQTRLLQFGAGKPPTGPATLQGHSLAQFELPRTRDPKVQAGSLRVVTNRMRPGYLRKNGVPYSADAVLTEDRICSSVRKRTLDCDHDS